MKTLFNSTENAVKVLSNASMKQVLGGYGEESSPEDGKCRVHCPEWPADYYKTIATCAIEASSYCRGGQHYDSCECDEW